MAQGNYIQYPVINHNGEESEEKHVYTHTHTRITESLCLQQKLTGHYKSAILQLKIYTYTRTTWAFQVQNELLFCKWNRQTVLT